jgi:hypothetical protein
VRSVRDRPWEQWLAGIVSGYLHAMPDFGDLEEVAKSHSHQVDEGLEKAKTEADSLADGRDRGIIDKAAQAAEKQVDGQVDSSATPTSSS